ncbi:MAG: hypothetical protein FJ225_03800 [Lentisphaerae bacterium]|nr:hypothetical protein [Lentisphaerota bacterium]
MKRLTLMASVLAAAALGQGAQPDSGEAVKTQDSVLVLYAPGIPGDLAARMVAWVERWYGISVEQREEAGLSEGLPADFLTRRIRGDVAKKRLVLLIVDSPPAEGEPDKSIQRLTATVSALNLATLRDARQQSDLQRQLFNERAEREALRAVAGLLALPECPFPRCPLSGHRDLAELDAKGRGLCPPCSICAAERVKTLGLSAQAREAERSDVSPGSP